MRRFVVYEDLCRVEAQTGEPSDLALSRTHQEIHFSIFEEGYSLSDPYDRLHVSVVPNWRWDRAVGGLQPRFIKGTEIDFQRAGYVFEGGNTHRFADLKGLEFTARGVARLEERADHFYFYLEQTNDAPTTTSAVVRTSMAPWSLTTTAWKHSRGAITFGCIGVWTPDTLWSTETSTLSEPCRNTNAWMHSAWNTTKHKASTPIGTF